jgi:hypothetical protein
LYEDLDGANWGYHDSDLYNELLTIDDALFVAVYNDFNEFYRSEMDAGETLRNWIDDDSFINGASLADAVMSRMDTFNLM